MRFSKSFLFVLGLALALGGAAGFTGPARAQSAPQAQPTTTEPLEIVTASGRHAFAIEVMRTDE